MIVFINLRVKGVILCSLIHYKYMGKRKKKARKRKKKPWVVHKLIPLLIAVRLVMEPIDLNSFITKGLFWF